MLLKRKFDKFVASQPLVAYKVYGHEFSIRLNIQEVQKNKFSTILGSYVNEGKAVIHDNEAYIVPDYDKYKIKPQNYKRQKLLQYVGEENFIIMINQAEIIVAEDNDKKRKQYFLKISQDNVRKYQCMMIAALLINSGLAKIDGDDSALFISYDFQQRLEKSSKIQSDLSRFRTLLGESNNLAAIIELVEKGKINQDKLFISENDVEDNELNIEMMSLVDLEMAKCTELNGEKGYELEVNFASWLLEHISNTSDRMSFCDLYES